MSIKLFKKALIVYKPIVLWNILVNLVIGIFFIIDGFEKPGGYAMAVFMKPVGWVFSVVIERFFLTKHAFFYKNMGLGFRKIFLNILIYDLVFLISIIILSFVCRNYLLTVLPTDLTNKRY